jgi:hypothetical protein
LLYKKLSPGNPYSLSRSYIHYISLHEHEHHTSRMVNFDASTPQLKVVKNWIDAYLTFDIKNVEPPISKNFQYQAFPETTDLPKETKENHIERYGEILAGTSKAEVRIQHRRCSQPDIHQP